MGAVIPITAPMKNIPSREAQSPTRRRINIYLRQGGYVIGAVCLSICLSVRLSVCPSVCLSTILSFCEQDYRKSNEMISLIES